MSEQLVTVKEAAALARVTVRTVERWIEKGAVKVYRAPAGGKLLIRRSDVEPVERASA